LSLSLSSGMSLAMPISMPGKSLVPWARHLRLPWLDKQDFRRNQDWWFSSPHAHTRDQDPFPVIRGGVKSIPHFSEIFPQLEHESCPPSLLSSATMSAYGSCWPVSLLLFLQSAEGVFYPESDLRLLKAEPGHVFHLGRKTTT
jgi:hypothetical protein